MYKLRQICGSKPDNQISINHQISQISESYLLDDNGITSSPSSSFNCTRPAIEAAKYQSTFASTLSYGCCDHENNYSCDDIQNLDNLLKYDEKENREFVENAQESMRLMEKESAASGCGDGETFPYIDFSDGKLHVLV